MPRTASDVSQVFFFLPRVLRRKIIIIGREMTFWQRGFGRILELWASNSSVRASFTLMQSGLISNAKTPSGAASSRQNAFAVSRCEFYEHAITYFACSSAISSDIMHPLFFPLACSGVLKLQGEPKQKDGANVPFIFFKHRVFYPAKLRMWWLER